MEAIRKVSEGGDPDVTPILLVVAEDDPDRVVKRHALFGLSRVSDRAAVPALRAGLRSRDRASRGHAIKGLEKLRSREAVPDLVNLLGDQYAGVMAADALVSIRDETALAPLRAAAAKGWPWRRVALARRVHALEAAVALRLE
jgi:HEAT repeat protein